MVGTHHTITVKRTKTSEFFQDSQPGLDTLVNAKRVGFCNVDILDYYIDAEILAQISNSTASKFILPFNDHRVQNFDQILEKVLSTCDGITFCHSQMYNTQKSSQHSEFNKTKDMELRFHNVASKFDDKTKIGHLQHLETLRVQRKEPKLLFQVVLYPHSATHLLLLAQRNHQVSILLILHHLFLLKRQCRI
jgi:hypothetical protein